MKHVDICRLGIGLLAACAWTARADTVVWTGASSTNWFSSANWTNAAGDAVVPAAGDDVIIDGGPRQPALSVAGGVTVQSLSIGQNNAAVLTIWNGRPDSDKLTVAAALTIGSTGVLTHADNSTGEVHRLHVRVGGDLTLVAGGKIDVTALGYDARLGPGAFTNTAGMRSAAHGGQGRGYNTSPDFINVQFPAGTAYGSATNPVRLGSGGDYQPGGGAIILDVAGAANLNGLVSADGHTNGIRSGSGGSVFLTTGTLTGNGLISAKGYCTGSTAGAGGGRIAVVVTNGASLDGVRMETFGSYNPATGLTGPYPAAAGTLYVKTTNDIHGRLHVDNNNNIVNTAGLSGTIQSMTFLCGDEGPVTNRFDEIVLTNNAMLVVGTNVTLELGTDTRFVCAGSSTNAIRSRLVVSATEGRLSLPADFALTNLVISQKGTNEIVWAANVSIGAGAMLTHEEGAGIRTNERHKLNVRIDGNLTVQSDGVIWATGRGYAYLKGPGFQGMGSGISAGAYGGQGSGYSNGIYMATGIPYGSLTRPDNLGSGGNANGGGGAVILSVSGTATVDGIIAANAFTNVIKTGSGGTVFITAGNLAGAGLMEAISYGRVGGGAGGGGRIAVVLTNGTSFGGVTFNAQGGANAYFGAAGSIYLKKAGEEYGRLIVSNHAFATPYLTLISPAVTDAEVGDVVIDSSGRLGLAAQQGLTVHGSFSNAGACVTAAGSVLELAGTNAATFWSGTNTVLAGLTCTTGVKRIEFAASKTVTVTNSLLLAGAAGAGNALTMRSTAPGTAWNLVVQGGAAQSVTHVDVQDSDASGGDPIATIDCVDSDRNLNWSFDEAGPITWTGGSNTVWSEGANWDLGRAPIPTDTEIIIAPSANDPKLDANRDLDNALTIQSGAALSLAGYNLTVRGAAAVAGALTATGTETITFTTNASFAGGTFTAAASTVRFLAAGAQTVTPGNATFHAVTISNSAASVFADGFRADSLVFDKAAAGATFQGAFTAGLFRCEAPAAALTFKNAAVYAVTNLLLRGTDGNKILLRSTSGGSAWLLAVSGWRFVRFVDVQDSNASGGKLIYAVDSIHSGNNQNWDFGGWKTWEGGVSADFTDPANWANGDAPDAASSVLLDGTGGFSPILTQAVSVARLTVGASQSTVLTINTNLTVSDEVLIMEQGTLTHGANPAGTDEPYKLLLTVGGDMTVLAGGKVDATAKGFPATYGPGATSNAYGGAAYGGQGLGYIQGPPDVFPGVGTCYGSILQPTRLGSGGAQRPGGGAIRLEVVGTLRVEGQILAEGDPSNNGYRTGSGGSVWITAGALAGKGLVSVASYGYFAGGGAGGGGRMAVLLTNAASFGAVQFRANGGNDSYVGAAGTIYLRHAADPVGQVLVDNLDIIRRGAVTQLPPPLLGVSDELKTIPLVITNMSWIGLTAEYRVGDLLVATNSLLSMSNYFLRVQAREHHLTDRAIPGPGGTNQVDHYEQILWGQATGTLILVR